MKNSLFLLPVLMTLLIGCSEKKNAPTCGTRDACLNDTSCVCWCSQICKYRKKEAADKPVYVEEDPNGKSCYCKQWDLDFYEDNCILHKGIKQPKMAD